MKFVSWMYKFNRIFSQTSKYQPVVSMGHKLDEWLLFAYAERCWVISSHSADYKFDIFSLVIDMISLFGS